MTDSLFPPDIHQSATEVVAAAGDAGVRLATAETVTGGLLAAALTEVPGVSRVYERGFVLYHAQAKTTGLGVDPVVAAQHGAVSAPVTAALAVGLGNHTGATVGVAVTGYAGPTGGTDANPVGTVYLAGYHRDGHAGSRREVFSGDRVQVKLAAVRGALDLLAEILGSQAAPR